MGGLDEFIARRNVQYGKPGYDLKKAMRQSARAWPSLSMRTRYWFNCACSNGSSSTRPHSVMKSTTVVLLNVRGVVESMDYNAKNTNTVMLPDAHRVWRVFGRIA